MKKTHLLLTIFILCLMTACSSKQSLQAYYLDSAENPNFLSFDLPRSILNLEDAVLTSIQKDALGSLKKLNVLAFKKNDANGSEYELEKIKLNAILNTQEYIELMKMNTSYGKAVVRYLGGDDSIDELIIYGDNDSKGFGVIRVLGDDMNPAQFIELLKVIQKSNFKAEGLEKLNDFLK